MKKNEKKNEKLLEIACIRMLLFFNKIEFKQFFFQKTRLWKSRFPETPKYNKSERKSYRWKSGMA